MKTRWIAILAIAGISLTFLVGTAGAQAPSQIIPGRYIVGVRPGVSPDGVIARHGFKPDHVYRGPVNGFAGPIPSAVAGTLIGDPDVMSVVPDRVVKAIGLPVEIDKPGNGGGHNNGGSTSGSASDPPQIVPAGVQRIGAVGLDVTGAGVGVAVVDTGLDFNQQDLTVSPVQYPAGAAQDDNGHGTHVGGIIAANDNTIDVVGVAPGATLYAVKVLDSSGRGSDSDVIAGLTWVSQNAATVTPPIDVVNMSLGRQGSLNDSPLLRAAVQTLTQAGISVVVAAGNDPTLEVSDEVPAGYPEVMAIASTPALDGTSQSRSYPGIISADTASYFTTDGAYTQTPDGWIGVTISAPGEHEEDINKASFIKSVGITSLKLGGGVTQMSGTSMASPHVAGVVALMWEAWLTRGTNTPLDPEQARTWIRSSADRVGLAPFDSPTSSYSYDGEREGIVDAPSAVLDALGP